jgi:acetyltransferase
MPAESPLHKILYPASIAFAGASNNPLKMGTLQALSIIKDGYRGKFMPLHPREKKVLGHTAYPQASDLPEVPDLAMLVVPADQVVPLMEDFGRIGTRRAIIITAGFRETGSRGQELEQKLLETARRYKIRFLGPNCIGIINTDISLNVTIAAWRGRPGRLGLISQSGTYVTQTLAYLRHKGIRFSKALSMGNEADLGLADALEYLGEDEQTTAIALYIEGIREGRRFIEAARKIAFRKPIVAQYVGGSPAGARAGNSHTASMAGPDYLYEGILKQAGIIRVHSVEELYGCGWALATQPALKGNRLAVVTNSGGPGTAIAHTANFGGMEVPRFSDHLEQKIRRHLPAHASAKNPVDLTFHMDNKLLSTVIPELIATSGEVDSLIIHGAMSTGLMREIHPHLAELLRGLSQEKFLARFEKDFTQAATLPRRCGLPLLVSSFFGHEDSHTAAYLKDDVPVFDAPEKAARAMLALLRHKTVRERRLGEAPPPPARSSVADEIIRAAVKQGRHTLDEYQAKRLLASYGITVPAEGPAASEEEAVRMAAEIGYPVALKACSHRLPHKTEKGLVFLNLKSVEDVRYAAGNIFESAGEPVLLLVSKMVAGSRELAMGMIRFPGFGPCVMLGLGGIFTEALADTSFRCAPLSLPEAAEMIGDLRSRRIFTAFRGMPAADTVAVARMLQTLGFAALLHPEIKEIDLNPVILEGSRPVAVDALINLTG